MTEPALDLPAKAPISPLSTRPPRRGAYPWGREKLSVLRGVSPRLPGGHASQRSDLTCGISVLCCNKMTLGGLLDDPWVGAGHHKDKDMTRGFRVSALSQPPFSREGRGAGKGAHE